MIVEFIAGRDEVKEIRSKITQEIQGIQQICYFHTPGGAFPVEGKIRVTGRVSPGKYSFEPIFKIGKYGYLEINPFAVPILTSARPEHVKATA